MSNDNKKNWERAWSTEEIVDHADNWNLACDAALLNTLKVFGDRVLNKSEEVHKRLDSLCNNLDKISLRADLARNEFNSLRNSQFVECRVYEEDETLLTKQEQEKKAENDVPKEETMEDLTKAVDLGLQILDKYYDKVEVTVSDSEDDEEEEMASYVYRRKDPYLHRPLPYVIGSEEWYKKWHVGLQESSDSENEKSASDKFSDSETDDNFEIKDQSDVSSVLSNVSGSENAKVRPVALSTANTSQQKDLLSTDGSTSPSNAMPKFSSFAEQLAAKLGNVIKENEGLLDETQVNRRPIQKKPSDYGALISDEPPPLDDNVIKEQESHGIFSGGKGLFDDEEDDNDTLWNPVKSKNAASTDHLGFNKSGARTVKSKGLFDEDSDDDIFASAQKSGINNQIKQPYLQTVKPPVPVFDEEPPLFEEEKEIAEKKKPVGGVSVFGKADLFQNRKIEDILKQGRVSSSDESNEDSSSSNIIKKISEPKINRVSNEENSHFINKVTKDSNKPIISNVPKVTEKIEDKIPIKKSNSLFEDTEPAVLENVTPKTKQSSLFDDIFVDDLFSDVNKKFSSSLFSEEDLFSEGDLIEPSQPVKKTSDPGLHIEAKAERSEVSKDKLFEGIDQPTDIKNEYDYSWKDNSKNKIGSLFDDTDEDDFDTFLSNKSNIVNEQHSNQIIVQSTEKHTKNETGKNRKPTLNLFEDEFEDVDDLFSNILNKKMKETKSASEVPQKKVTQSENLEKKPTISKKPEQISSKKPEVQPESSIEQKETPSSYSLSNEKDFERQLITNKSIDASQGNNSSETVNKVQENTEIHEEINCEEHSKIDSIQRLDNLSGEQSLPTISKLGVETVPNTLSALSRSTVNIPQVNFLDSNPPPDDGWDNTSDNIFDDAEPYGNDGFQSRPSSLFDNEPPSLFFNETSGIVKDVPEDRVGSVNSFDPSLTSSRRLSSDIFSDIQNDSILISKNQEGSNIASTPNLQCVPEISDFLSDNNTDLTPSGNPEDIYSPITTVDATEQGSSSGSRGDNIFDRSPPIDKRTSDKLSDFADREEVVHESEFDAQPPDTNNHKPTGEDLEKKNSSASKKEQKVTLLDDDSKHEIWNENKESNVGNISVEENFKKELVGKPNKPGFETVPASDDLFNAFGEEDIFSAERGLFGEAKISLKPSLSDPKTNDIKYFEDISDTVNPSNVIRRQDEAVPSAATNTGKYVNREEEDIRKEKHVAINKLDEDLKGSFENPVSLFDDIFGNLAIPDMSFTGENPDDKPKINPKPSVKLKTTEKQLTDKFESFENIEGGDGVLFDTEVRPPIKNKKPEVGDISTDKLERGESFENEKKSISMFDDLSDNQAEYTHQILSIKKQDADIDDFINREYVISDNASVEKRVSFDENIVDNDLIEESLHQEDSDEMQNNISKIAERLQQISNKQDDKPKPAVVPGKLSHRLNINVGALLPGSAPPRREKVQSADVKSEDATSEELDFSRKPIPILRTQSETHTIAREYKLEKSVSFDNAADVEVLPSVTKNRPKIPVKRRPSTRSARQQSLRDSIPDIQVTDDSTPGEKHEEHNVPSTDPPEKVPTQVQSSVLQHKSTPNAEISTDKDNIQSVESSTKKHQEEIPKIEKKQSDEPLPDYLMEHPKSDIKKHISLFDDKEDETNDLFTTIQKDKRTANRAKISDEPLHVPGTLNEHSKIDVKKKISLFDDKEDETEELFTAVQKDKKNAKRAEIVNTKKEDISSESGLFRKMSVEKKGNPETTPHKLNRKKVEVKELFDSFDDNEFGKNNEESSASTIKEKITAKKKGPSSSVIDESAKSSKTLFDSSDEDDDFLKSLATTKNSLKEINSSKMIPRVKIKSKLFDDENCDEDIFGIGTSNKSARHDTKPSVINKNTPKSSSLRKLKNVEGDEDPLSALLK